MTRWLDELMVLTMPRASSRPYAKTVEGLRQSHGTLVIGRGYQVSGEGGT